MLIQKAFRNTNTVSLNIMRMKNAKNNKIITTIINGD